MDAKVPQFSLAAEDRWLIATLSTVASLVEPVGPFAAEKRRLLSDTRLFLKNVSSVLARELKADKVPYELRAAVIGPIEVTVLDLGVKLASREETEAEIEDERIVQEEIETVELELAEEPLEEAEAEQQAEAEQPAEPELAEEGADPNEDGVDDAADLPEEPAEEDAVEEAVEPAYEAVEPVNEIVEQVEDAADPVVEAAVPVLNPIVVPPGDEQEQVSCFYCERGHPLCKCPAIQKQDGKQRRATIIDLGLCFNCFSKKHRVFYCPVVVGRCLKCPKRHHTLLHGLV